MSCKISEETKQRLIQLVARQGETLNSHLSELIEADVELMSDSEKAGGNPGNPGNSDAVQCPECGALTARAAFQKHFDSLHKRSMSESEFGDILDRMIEGRDGKKFSESEIKIAKGIFTELKSKGFIK